MILRLQPNLRTEDPANSSGYIWGKPAQDSEILKNLPTWHTHSLKPDTLVAERWMVSDDPTHGSVTTEGDLLKDLFSQQPAWFFSKEHLEAFGPSLHTIMKHLDTHSHALRGSLSVQIHPKPGHPTRPSKPEMWLGLGNASVYMGWKEDMTEESIRAHVAAGTITEAMHCIDLRDDALLVPGGTPHAIRFDSSLYEWSKAPDNQGSSSLKDATVALYDRTDGKQARPGKEDMEGSLEVLAHAESLRAVDPKQFYTLEEETHATDTATFTQVFSTPELLVHRIDLRGPHTLTLDRGLPCFLERGSLSIEHNGSTYTFEQGEDFFLPYGLQSVMLSPLNESEARLWTWVRPL